MQLIDECFLLLEIHRPNAVFGCDEDLRRDATHVFPRSRSAGTNGMTPRSYARRWSSIGARLTSITKLPPARATSATNLRSASTTLGHQSICLLVDSLRCPEGNEFDTSVRLGELIDPIDDPERADAEIPQSGERVRLSLPYVRSDHDIRERSAQSRQTPCWLTKQIICPSTRSSR